MRALSAGLEQRGLDWESALGLSRNSHSFSWFCTSGWEFTWHSQNPARTQKVGTNGVKTDLREFVCGQTRPGMRPRVLNSLQGLGFCFFLLFSPPLLTAQFLHQLHGSKQDKKADPGIFGFYSCSDCTSQTFPATTNP